jgi:hypothetical protein
MGGRLHKLNAGFYNVIYKFSPNDLSVLESMGTTS